MCNTSTITESLTFLEHHDGNFCDWLYALHKLDELIPISPKRINYNKIEMDLAHIAACSQACDFDLSSVFHNLPPQFLLY